MHITTYAQAIKYLESFIGKVIFKVDPKSIRKQHPLERIRVLLNLLGNPQDKFKSVLVGGTSGKGSTAYLISHILTTAGYKTGFTVSPHLQKINERLQISGKEISNIEFTGMVASMIRIIERMKKMQLGAPSYFEILIAMAFLYFSQQKVDIAVVEVGMGGEFDATNTLSPLIAVVTNVSLDHTSVLGKTVQKIARTKAGIIKNSKLIVVTGVKQPSVIKIVEDRCKKIGAKLYRLHKDFKLTNLKLSLPGQYQKENANLAIQTIVQLKKFGFKISKENIKKALSTAFFPGRFEVLKCHPEFISGSPAIRQASSQSNKMLKQVQHDKRTMMILDGAHNPTKMRAFLSALKKLYPKERKIFIVGFKFDKEIKKMLKEILGVADEIIVTQFKAKTDTSIHASAEADSIKHEVLGMKYTGKINIEKDSKKALKKAIKVSDLEKNSIVVVTGSLYLVGEIRSML